MTNDERRRLIERYRDGYAEVMRALSGIGPAELDARPVPGTWSPRDIAHHLADSEMTSAIRLRRLIAEDEPHIVAYDQEEYARKLYYDRPIEASLDAFKAARACTVELLERLTPEQWQRTGTHSEVGTYSVEQWLEIYAGHAHGHADQIRRARAGAAKA